MKKVLKPRALVTLLDKPGADIYVFRAFLCFGHVCMSR